VFSELIMKDSIKIAFVFIGTIVGAGLASGQEILQFFSLYGIKGFYGIILCCSLYLIFSILIVNLCFKYKYKSYRDILISIFGNKAGTVIDLFLSFFIFGSSTIMISGGGAMLHEYAGIKTYWGIFIMCIIVFFITILSTKGLIAINTIEVPYSVSIILMLGVLVFLSISRIGDINAFLYGIAPIKKNWLTSGILYSAFNIIGATGVICPMTNDIKNKKSFIYGCIVGSIVLTMLALSINFTILIYSPQSYHNEIPNLFIANHYGKLISLCLTIIIWLEMLSTEISDIYSLSYRIHYSSKLSYTTCVLIIMLLSIPFSFLGFSNLIALLYPPFGVVGIIFLIGCIYKYFTSRC
jgi:uncharacterized membrane protein YkvI